MGTLFLCRQGKEETEYRSPMLPSVCGGWGILQGHTVFSGTKFGFGSRYLCLVMLVTGRASRGSGNLWVRKDRPMVGGLRPCKEWPEGKAYCGSDESQEDRLKKSHPALETVDKGGSMMCKDVHRFLAYMSVILCVTSPISAQGRVLKQARKEGVLVKNVGFHILWSCGTSPFIHGSFW